MYGSVFTLSDTLPLVMWGPVLPKTNYNRPTPRVLDPPRTRLPKDVPRVMKVKVGGAVGPSTDAARTLRSLRGLPAGFSLRLDANQAWSTDEALCFASALAEGGCGAEGRGDGGTCAGVGAVEYIEEPLRNPRMLREFWERSGGGLPYALDESLAMGREAFADDVS